MLRLDLGCALQRLFSTFPNSWPGFGLLLIRLCLGIALIHFGSNHLLSDRAQPFPFTQNSTCILSGILLIAGVWTPVVAILAALNEVLVAVSSFSHPSEDLWIHVSRGVLAISTAMLGPGAWSIDARVFGRRRIDLHRSRGSKSSPQKG
jgi:putative oxidoreductase